MIYKRLASYALEHWRYLILALFALIITALTQPLFAAYMKPLLDGTFMQWKLEMRLGSLFVELVEGRFSLRKHSTLLKQRARDPGNNLSIDAIFTDQDRLHTDSWHR